MFFDECSHDEEYEFKLKMSAQDPESEVYNLIGNVKGVQSVINVIFNNLAGTELGYSQFKYDFETATKDGIIYPSLDPSLFEIKYPDTDIKGKIKQY